MKAKAKQTKKIRVSGQRLMHARTSLHTYNQACIRGQDYAYTGSCLETLKTQQQGRTLKQEF